MFRRMKRHNGFGLALLLLALSGAFEPAHARVTTNTNTVQAGGGVTWTDGDAVDKLVRPWGAGTKIIIIIAAIIFMA